MIKRLTLTVTHTLPLRLSRRYLVIYGYVAIHFCYTYHLNLKIVTVIANQSTEINGVIDRVDKF